MFWRTFPTKFRRIVEAEVEAVTVAVEIAVAVVGSLSVVVAAASTLPGEACQR